MTFLPFEEARKYVHKIGLKSQSQWVEYYRSGKLPTTIPRTPERVYKNSNGWKGWGDWLGTGNLANQFKVYRSFTEAREFIHRLKLKTAKEWKTYCKAGKKPRNIPSAPWHVYRTRWRSMGDWLGTDFKYLPFEEARHFVLNLGLKSYSNWTQYCKSGLKPANLPLGADKVYYKDWKGWGNFLGTGKKAQFKGEYRPFEAARSYVQNLGLKTQKEWSEYAQGKSKPDDIPAGPAGVYRSYGWKGIGDWLGTGRVANQQLDFVAFTEAKKVVHSLGLKSSTEWRQYIKSGKKPAGIPANPSRVYSEYWKGMGDWLGTGTIAPRERHFKPFEAARAFAHSLKIRGQKEWTDYCKTHKLPSDIPASPSRVYRQDWDGWGDWLGTGYIAPSKRKYRSFEKAKEFVNALGLHSRNEWEAYCKSGEKPTDIPYQARQTYGQKWKGWGDWLGTGTVANFERNFKSFKEARDFVHTLGLPTQENWREYCRSGKKPGDIPANPARTYGSEWKGFGDWLGTGRTRNFRPFEEARNYVMTLGLKNRDSWSAYAKTRNKPSDIPGDPAYVYKKNWKSWGDWLGTGTVAH